MGCFVCFAVVLGILLARSLFLKAAYITSSRTTHASSSKPTDLSGMYFNGKDALKTSFSYDNPFLSILFWMKPAAPNEDDDMMIVGNRELSCDVHLKTDGYAVFYNHKNRTVSVMWRSKRSRCEVLSTPIQAIDNLWTHVAVLFRPFEPEVDVERFNEGAYPMIVDLYINGKLAATKTQIRFFSDNSDKISIGGSNENQHPFRGRLFMLMILKSRFVQDDIQEIYEGKGLAMESYFNAAVAYGFQHSLIVCKQTRYFE